MARTNLRSQQHLRGMAGRERKFGDLRGALAGVRSIASVLELLEWVSGELLDDVIAEIDAIGIKPN